jgi:hypothetical protein
MSIRLILISAALAAVALGWYQLFLFSSTPGEQFAAPASWPQDIPALPATLPSGGHTPLLLVFVHPRCSCTPATLEQFDQLLDSTPTPVQVALVVYRSKAVSQQAPGAEQAPMLRVHSQARIQVLPDTNGLLARRFGAATSGEIVLYSANGHLLFQGGITPMRSQTGNSAGADALRNALATGAIQAKAASVFGCKIFLPGHAG